MLLCFEICAGKGEGNWDRFCHEGGHIDNNDNGDVADDSYNRYQDDIAALKNLGVSPCLTS